MTALESRILGLGTTPFRDAFRVYIYKGSIKVPCEFYEGSIESIAESFWV